MFTKLKKIFKEKNIQIESTLTTDKLVELKKIKLDKIKYKDDYNKNYYDVVRQIKTLMEELKYDELTFFRDIGSTYIAGINKLAKYRIILKLNYYMRYKTLDIFIHDETCTCILEFRKAKCFVAELSSLNTKIEFVCRLLNYIKSDEFVQSLIDKEKLDQEK